MARAFLAIELPPVVGDAVAARLDGIDLAGGRHVPREQWHLTVRFLGNEVDLPVVCEELARSPLPVGPGTLQVGGARALGRARRAQVLAFGLALGAEWLREVAAALDERLRPVGFGDVEPGRRFVPHLTIARYRVPTDLRGVRDAVGADPVGPPWEAGEVVLFSSVLGSGGAEHSVVACVPVE